MGRSLRRCDTNYCLLCLGHRRHLPNPALPVHPSQILLPEKIEMNFLLEVEGVAMTNARSKIAYMVSI
jgi:hypothetical protein